MLLTGLL